MLKKIRRKKTRFTRAGLTRSFIALFFLLVIFYIVIPAEPVLALDAGKPACPACPAMAVANGEAPQMRDAGIQKLRKFEIKIILE